MPHQIYVTVFDTETKEALKWSMLWSRLVSLVSDHLSHRALVILAPPVYISSSVYWNRFMLLPLKKYILTTQDSTCKYYFWSLSGGAFRYDFTGLSFLYTYIYNLRTTHSALEVQCCCCYSYCFITHVQIYLHSLSHKLILLS